MSTDQQRATIDDLRSVDGKAELIDGRIVHFMPTGFKPSRVAGRIFRSLDDHADAAGNAVALGDNTGFAVEVLSSGRQSFSPDAAFYTGPIPENEMSFLPAAPVFAVEVRSENDYGDAAEQALAEKRADYFEAGTLVVWDVDPVAECIYVHRQSGSRVTFHRGDEADAEPAVPGWHVTVDWIFG